MLVTEAVGKLSSHGEDSDDHGKDVWRRCTLARSELDINVIRHDSKNDAREKELNETNSQDEQIGRGKSCQLSDLGHARHARKPLVVALAKGVPHLHFGGGLFGRLEC